MKRFINNLSTNAKLFFSFGIILILLAAVIIAAYLSLARFTAEYEYATAITGTTLSPAPNPAAPSCRSRRLLRFVRETAGLPAWRQAPSFGVRTALGPFLLKGVPH